MKTTAAAAVVFESGPDGFVKVQIKDGVRSAMPLTAQDLPALRRIFQQTLDRIASRRIGQRLRGHPNLQAAVYLPATAVNVNEDIHRTEILLTIRDPFGIEARYILAPRLAVQVADSLIRRARTLTEGDGGKRQ